MKNLKKRFALFFNIICCVAASFTNAIFAYPLCIILYLA